jgi:transposase
VGWALRPATVRNIALWAANCNVRKNRNRFRGLNRNHNHEMKEIFKGAATRASCGVGPLRDFYVALLAKGMKPEMARLTLARKIAAIALTLWKKEGRFDAEQLKPQAA